jgi:hypothetical protein
MSRVGGAIRFAGVSASGIGGACGPARVNESRVGGACGPARVNESRVGGACGPPPPFAAPLVPRYALTSGATPRVRAGRPRGRYLALTFLDFGPVLTTGSLTAHVVAHELDCSR